MDGMWEKPFGFNYMAFGNLVVGIEVSPAIPVPGFELAGELRLGKIGAGNEIVAQVAVGFGISPNDIYAYAKVKPFTLGALAKAFEFNVALPKPVMDTGFPDGVIVGLSFSPKGKLDHDFSNIKKIRHISAYCCLVVDRQPILLKQLLNH